MGHVPSVRSQTTMLVPRAADRARRLALTSALWGANGIEDSIGLQTIRAELTGLAQELRMATSEAVADALDAAVDALSCTETLRRATQATLGRRILVLDDNEITGDLIAIALEGVGCVVAVTLVLSDCIQRFIDFEPDLILLEPAHPDFQDVGSLQTLRKRLRSASVPVILFSEEDDTELSKRALSLDADGFLAKDRGIPQLVGKVQEILSEIIW